jgi:hypothetical protein
LILFSGGRKTGVPLDLVEVDSDFTRRGQNFARDASRGLCKKSQMKEEIWQSL